MDPNETLRMLHAAFLRLDASPDGFALAECAAQVSELFESLDEWLSKGGFLPDAWDHSARQAEPEPDAGRVIHDSDFWATGRPGKPAEVRYHSSDDMDELDVAEPVAVAIRLDGSVDAYGYIAVIDQR